MKQVCGATRRWRAKTIKGVLESTDMAMERAQASRRLRQVGSVVAHIRALEHKYMQSNASLAGVKLSWMTKGTLNTINTLAHSSKEVGVTEGGWEYPSSNFLKKFASLHQLQGRREDKKWRRT